MRTINPTLPGKGGDDTSGSCDAPVGAGGQYGASHSEVDPDPTSPTLRMLGTGSAGEGASESGRPRFESLTFQNHL